MTDNDGVFTCDETIWGKHLFRIVADHAELLGLRIGFNPEMIYREIAERAKY